MNRVWKKFFIKVGTIIAIIVGILGYILVLAGLITLFGVNPRFASFLIFGVGFGVPMLVFFLYTTYKDAKYEVEYENKELLKKIKG